MKEIMRKLLSELLKDSKRSDRELAKVLGVSQTTVSRMKQRLLKEGIVKEFSVIPDFAKMGYEIMAFSCAKFRTEKMSELREKARKWMYEHPNIIFNSRAKGMGKHAIMITLHKSYTDYDEFIEKYGSEKNPDAWAIWFSVAAFFNGVGVLVGRNLIDIDLVEELLGNITDRMWTVMGPVLKEWREQGTTQKMRKYELLHGFEYLYNLMSSRNTF